MPSRRDALVRGITLATLGGHRIARAQSEAGERPGIVRRDSKAVLVELFASQGCDLCPKGEQLLGQLAREFGPARVVPVSFHVDYFNDPWKDPYSNATHSRREMQYSLLYTRANKIDNQSYLYLTPLLMIDGRVPMVASNDDAPSRARAAIREALAAPGRLAIDVSFEQAQPGAAARGDTAQRAGTLLATLRPLGASFAGKEVLVQAVVTEDGLSTNVGSGELKGKTYNGHYTARSFAFESVTVDRDRGTEARFSITLPREANPQKSAIVVIVQDEATGAVLQSRSVPWLGTPAIEGDNNQAPTSRRRR